MKTTLTSTNQLVDTSYYTPVQLSLPIDLFHQFKKSDPIHTFMQVMRGVNISKFINSKRVGRQEYDDAMMLRIVLFAYMENITSLRGITKACCVDTRFIWLARGQRPSHMAFQRFISDKLTDSIQDIFTTLNTHIITHQNINTDELFIDGTKIEANARKFSFVWKKSVLKNQANLMIKIRKDIKTYNQAYQTNIPILDFYLPKDIQLILSDTGNKIRFENIGFVYGKGTRKHPLQRYYEAFSFYHLKALEYEQHLKICGARNSYSKTDHDATFMHGKEDYYNKTGIFKPNYNIQIGVSDGFILEAKTFPNPTDTKTFIPLLKNYKKRYGFYPQRPVADAGYGSYENYLFCISNEMELWQKYSYYSKEKRHHFKRKVTMSRT